MQGHIRRAFASRWSGGRVLRRMGALVLGVLLLLGALPVLASTVDISIPLETIVRGPEGSTHVLAVVDVPSESRGETCQATVVARNQDSEHPNSDLRISSATFIDIRDVENTAYGTVIIGGPITLSGTVTVTLTLGSDEVFSAGLDVEIDCPPLNPTTTTTTTEPGSSSTEGPGGSTTSSSEGPGGSTTSSSEGPGGSTTSSSEGPGGSTTSSSEGPGGSTTSSSEGPGDTTDSSVMGTTITAPSSTVAGSSESLPFTGSSEESMGGIAVALMILGFLVLLSVRRRESEVTVARHWNSRIAFYDFGH